MKKILSTLFILCAVLTFSCTKDNPPHALFLGATLNNKNWIAQPSTSYFANRDSLQINGLYTSSDQSLVMKIRFNGVGNYTLSGDQASFNIFLLSGGVSAPIASYKLDTTQTNTMSITQYNIKTNIATGKFQIYLVKTQGGASYDNKLSFTNGSFWIQLPPVN